MIIKLKCFVYIVPQFKANADEENKKFLGPEDQTSGKKFLKQARSKDGHNVHGSQTSAFFFLFKAGIQTP